MPRAGLLARTIYIGCTYGIYGREITIYAVIYGVYIHTVLASPSRVSFSTYHHFSSFSLYHKAVNTHEV